MVRTRSGKATTREVDEDTAVEKKVKQPTKASKAPKTKKPEPSNAVKESANAGKAEVKSKPGAGAAAHVSFENNVKDQPGKTYLKSPTVKSLKKAFTFPSINSKGAAFREKLRKSPFFFSSSLCAMLVLTLSALTVRDQISGTSTLAQFVLLVLAVHFLDIVANVFNEVVDGKSNSDAAFFFTEAGLNVSEVMLFLHTVHPSGTPSFVTIAFVVGSMFPACWLNVRFRDDDKMWVRMLAYAVLVGCLLVNAAAVSQDRRLCLYGFLVVHAMLVDLLDVPDAYTPLSWCDGMVMVLRSIGCYVLVTHSLLRTGGASLTGFEMEMVRMVGF